MPSKSKKCPYYIQVFVQNVFLPHYIDVFPCGTSTLQRFLYVAKGKCDSLVVVRDENIVFRLW